MLQALVRRPLVPSPTPTILVLLHGLGADEHDLMGLAPDLDLTLCIVSIRAPIQAVNGGYAWFPVSWDSDGIHADTSQAVLSRDILLETLRGLPVALDLPNSPMLIGGFSQGAMMSLGVALADPQMIKGVLLMSGRLLHEFVPRELAAGLQDVPFLVQHGISDPVLPIEGSRLIRDRLREWGCTVTYLEYPMAHQISQDSLEDARDWIVERLQGREDSP